MTKTAIDLKFYLNDNLEAVLARVKAIESLTTLNVTCKADKNKLMEALVKLEKDIDDVQKIIGDIQ